MNPHPRVSRFGLPPVVRCALTLWCIFQCAGVVCAGRGDKVGTASGTQLLIPVSARSIGLGSADLATVSGVEALSLNPAGLVGEAAGPSLLVSHMNYIGDIGVEFAGAGFSLPDIGSVGFTLRSLSFGDIPVTTEDQPDGTGSVTSPGFLVGGVTFARQLSEQISVGITVNVISETMADVSTAGVAFNGGVQYAGLGGIPGLSVGVAVRNIGPQLTYHGDGLTRVGRLDDILRGDAQYAVEAAGADLPSIIEIGVAFTVPMEDATHIRVVSSFQNNNASDDLYKFGFEVGFRVVAALRLGTAYSPVEEGGETIFGPTVGVGLTSSVGTVRWSFDYAYRMLRYFAGNQVVTLGVNF